jgi:hypothetical protein
MTHPTHLLSDLSMRARGPIPTAVLLIELQSELQAEPQAERGELLPSRSLIPE